MALDGLEAELRKKFKQAVKFQLSDMVNLVIQEPIIRLAAFIAVLAAMVLWETVAPRRSRSHARIQRWPSNFVIVALNTGLLRILLPSGATGLALLAEQRRWGLLYN